MSKRKPVEVLRANLGEHPASQWWMTLNATGAAPREIHVLKQTIKTEVYRLCGLGGNQHDVVAKRRTCEAIAQEAVIYRDILVHLQISRLCCYGHVNEPDGQHGWLFLEDAGGEPYRAQELDHQMLAARWLAHMHGTAAEVVALRRLLPTRGTAWQLESLRTARSATRALSGDPVLAADERHVLGAVTGQLDHLETRWHEVEERCAVVPLTLAHGDFVSKNMRVRPGDHGAVLLPFDWEDACWSAPAVDLLIVEPALYWDVYRHYQPEVTLSQIHGMVWTGTLFRMIAAIWWAAMGLSRHRNRRDVWKLGMYLSALEAALKAGVGAGWTGLSWGNPYGEPRGL